MKIGDKVKDKFSPLTGWIHGRAEYITGCDTVLVNPRTLDEKGKPTDGTWLDSTRVELIEAQTTPEKRDAGGPTPGEQAGARRS